jgi:hypothetical protein
LFGHHSHPSSIVIVGLILIIIVNLVGQLLERLSVFEVELEAIRLEESAALVAKRTKDIRRCANLCKLMEDSIKRYFVTNPSLMCPVNERIIPNGKFTLNPEPYAPTFARRWRVWNGAFTINPKPETVHSNP